MINESERRTFRRSPFPDSDAFPGRRRSLGPGRRSHHCPAGVRIGQPGRQRHGRVVAGSDQATAPGHRPSAHALDNKRLNSRSSSRRNAAALPPESSRRSLSWARLLSTSPVVSGVGRVVTSAKPPASSMDRTYRPSTVEPSCETPPHGCNSVPGRTCRRSAFPESCCLEHPLVIALVPAVQSREVRSAAGLPPGTPVGGQNVLQGLLHEGFFTLQLVRLRWCAEQPGRGCRGPPPGRWPW
jgi:hypothetical protein